ncbi:Riboflavin biosynthesis protein ribF [Strawberry lethal yellows phytoplasma (CPA) str. NZSb11]|uniref:Bifunctional riboflavin kinase/FMN adenylyltransferase n=1 Tax=Strawberry lethal yellows phytoplasma (CPA) str. NZSb11 TaxID=980422 RepID=R4S032_PHYAS|nr:Riboflavin biosynthesis protein ribF [Strawberry lethal yellows phytoplasma (CPA) str. NZSb11]
MALESKISLLKKTDFIRLLQKINVKRVIITQESRFGYQKEGNYQTLKQAGFLVDLIDDYVKPNGCQQKISTTCIKKLLTQGKIDDANLYLSRPYKIQGKVIQGKQRGRLLGFRTANLELINFFLPRLGVYAVFVTYKKEKYAGIANLGVRPTFEQKPQKLLEIHLLNFDQNLYHQTIEVEFIAFLRNEKKFENVSQLIFQIKKDVLDAKTLLKTKM